MGGTTAARFTMEPGWRWSDCVKPVAGTDSCQHRHVGVVQSGRMRDYTRGHEILDAMRRATRRADERRSRDTTWPFA
jgi:hypothetical protein